MALPTLGVKDKDGVDRTINTPNSGRQAAADSQAHVMSTEDKAVFGSPTDARATATDTTSVGVISLLKQISFSIQAFVTTFGAAWTRNAGNVDANTQRVVLAADTVNSNGRVAGSLSAPVAVADEEFALLTTVAALSKAEDAVAGSGDTGIPALAVRRDAKSSGAADGDYALPSLNAAGDLKVDGGAAHVISVAPTVTAGAYTADDLIGGEQTLSAAARVSGGGGILTGLSMVAEDDSADGWAANDIEVMIFKSNPAGTYTDNNALNGSALTDADAFLLLGTVLLDTKVSLGNVSMLKASHVHIPYICVGSADLFAVAINRGGKTPEATDAIQFNYHFIRD